MSSTQLASSDDDPPKHPDDRSDREAMGFANTRDFMLAYGLKLENPDDYEAAKDIRDALQERDAQEYAEKELSRSSAAQESEADQQPQQDEQQHDHDHDSGEQYDSEGSEASYYDPNGYNSHLSHSCSSDNDFDYEDDAEPDYDASGHDDYHYDDYGDDYCDDGYD